MKIICIFDFVLGAINFFAWMVTGHTLSLIAMIFCTAAGILGLAD